MEDAIKQIGERLKGLREVLDIPAQDVAELCGITLDAYLRAEDGEAELSISSMQKISRRKAYKYQSLASGFRGRKADPFMVLVEPKPDGTPLEKNSHQGQEFDMVTEGSLEITIGKKVLVLNEGDSIYFDASQPHCMRALGGKAVKFLAIIF